MKNLKFELVKTEEVGTNKNIINTYENEYYALVTGWATVRLYLKEDIKYIPDLFIDDDFLSGEIKGIKIQTTSYGSLGVEDIEKVIEGLQIGKESAQEAEKILRDLGLLK